MSTLVLAAALNLLQVAAADSPRLPREIELGESTVAGWKVHAWTDLNRGGEQPSIRAVLCEMEQAMLRLTTSDIGGLGIDFVDTDDYDAEEIRSVEIGGVTWEHRWRPQAPEDWQFLDVDYPSPREPCEGLSSYYIIHNGCGIEAKVGAWQVRRRGEELWVPLGTLPNELLRAQTVRVGYRLDDEEPDTELRYDEISLTGLREALVWCDTVMHLDSARLLNRP